jgi:hypothetical protein
MDFDAVELCIALNGYIIILVLKCPFPVDSQSVHYSANNRIADEMAGGLETFWHPCIRLRELSYRQGQGNFIDLF